MRVKSILGLVFFVWITQSCVKEFSAPVNDLPPQLTVNSLFTQDSLFKIHVSITSGMSQTPELVDNATVIVYKNGFPIEPFESLGLGWYQADHFPEINANYTVKAWAQGFDTVWAQSSVPEYPEIIGQPIAKIFGYMNRHGDQLLARDLYFTFQDIGLGEHYYEFNKMSWCHTERISDPSLINDSELDVNWGALYFSNDLFRGNIKTMVIPGIGSSFLDLPVIEEPTHIQIIFSSISKEYFLYRKSLYRHLNNLNSLNSYYNPLDILFLGSPQELYTNVHGGRGVFAGHNFRNIDVLLEF